MTLLLLLSNFAKCAISYAVNVPSAVNLCMVSVPLVLFVPDVEVESAVARLIITMPEPPAPEFAPKGVGTPSP